jgi:hypothetical protein
MNPPEIGPREMAELGGCNRARRERVEHQSPPDRVAERPLAVFGNQSQLFASRPDGGDERQQVVFPQPLVDQQRCEHAGMGIEQKDLDQRRAAAARRGHPLAEGELVDAEEKLRIDRPADRGGDLDVDREAEQIEPVEIMNELDGVGLGRLPVRDEPEPDRIESRQPGVLRDLREDLRGDVPVLEDGERLILEERAGVFMNKTVELVQSRKMPHAGGVDRSKERIGANLLYESQLLMIIIASPLRQLPLPEDL